MTIPIEGMHCQACVARVRKALEKVAGVGVQRVDIGSAEVSLDPSREPSLLEAIRNAGYQPGKPE